MFTGLIEEIGIVKKVVTGSKSAQIEIQGKKILEDVKVGDSIATNGVCLTVISFTGTTFTVDVMPETIRRSNLKNLKNGSKVNLERALRLSDRLGGHIVSGHIDDTGIITEFTEEENATWVTIKVNKSIIKYIINKGSVAIDGTSLTVASVDEETFKVSIIPLTKDKTILLSKRVGDDVNIECDVVGKYIEKLIKNEEKEENQSSNITMDFLRKHGF